MASAAGTQLTLDPLDPAGVIDFVTCVDEGLIEGSAASWRVFVAAHNAGAQRRRANPSLAVQRAEGRQTNGHRAGTDPVLHR